MPAGVADHTFLAEQAQILEMLVRGRPLPDVLGAICATIERHAGPRIVAEVQLRDGVPAVVDAATWTLPIASSTGDELGRIAIRRVGSPRSEPPFDHALVDVLVRTAALAIERERSERLLRDHITRQRFFVELDSATQSLLEPSAVMATTARMLAEYLDVDRCAYAEVLDEQVFLITGDHPRNGVPSIVGRWDVAAFGPACVQHMLAGTPYVVVDSEADPRVLAEHLPAYRATTIRAVVCVPLHKAGVFTAAMAVHQRVPRRWTPGEIELVGLVVARCWEALERSRINRARSVAALALEESRARLDYTVRLSGVGFWYCDLPFDELSWDARVKNHFFLPADARVTIDLFYDRLHTDDREPTRAAIESSITQHRSYDVVYRTVDPESGAVKWIRAIGGAAYAADGSPVRFDGVTVDVTAQKLDEVRLAGVARAALTIHSSSSVGSVLQVATEEARALIGAHRAETRVISDDGPVSTTAWADPQHRDLAAPGGGVLSVPLVGRGDTRRSDTQLGVLELFGKLDGEFTATDRAVAIQLAQLAVVAIENARLYDRLRDQDRRKDEFLATLAHELRNPLAPIRTGLHVLEQDITGEQSVRTRAMMTRQLSHLVHMVDDLLDISRVTLGKITLKKQRVDFRDVLGSALETTRALIDAGGHELVVQLPPEPLPLDVDATRCSQVLANLLNNAAKYTPSGGRITLAVERTAVSPHALIARVSDTGIGIPGEMLPYVFDMFTQVGRSLDRAQGGLGLGLTLVRRLVEMHGGSVVAESAGPNLGSSFIVTLPLAATPAETSSPAIPIAPVSGRRILVVDDNVDGAEMLSMLLELHGNTLRVAHTGPDALEAAAAFRPHVILLDIGLPGLNGYEVARRLRAEPTEPRPLLIAVTGWGSDEDRRQVKAAGFDHHLVKPVDLLRLEALLGELTAGTDS